MNEVNKTLYIPLYGKSAVSRKHILLNDPVAERIWDAEELPVGVKSKSKWLSYNMAMRARIFDDWTDSMLVQCEDPMVLHIGCGLDSRCERVRTPYQTWIDCDLPEVISLRRKYFLETEQYHMLSLDASNPKQIESLPDSSTAIILLEGLCMYLTSDQLHTFLQVLQEKYPKLHILMDVYTVFGAKASRFKNPVNDVGVTKLYGVDNLESILNGLPIRVKAEHSFTPEHLVKELNPTEQAFFRMLFNRKIYQKVYRLYELESI